MRPVRVVSLVSSVNTSVGGVSSWSTRMATEFANDPGLGVEWHTVHHWRGTARPQAEHLAAPNAHPCDLAGLGTITPLHELVTALKPDVIVPNYGRVSYSAARRSGAAVLGILHTDDTHTRDEVRQHQWAAGVGVSRACHAYMETIGDVRPLAHIPYGVPIAHMPRRVTQGGPLRLVYVGRIVQRQKRVFDLLILAQQLLSRRVGFELHVIGDGPEEAAFNISVYQHPELRRVVKIHGAQPWSYVADTLSRSDVSVLVSDSEGLSLSMLEAMGAGVVPCVTAVSSGVDDVVAHGRNGIVSLVGDMETMADQLESLSQDRERLAMLGRAAWKTVNESGLTTRAAAEGYAKLIRSMVVV